MLVRRQVAKKNQNIFMHKPLISQHTHIWEETGRNNAKACFGKCLINTLPFLLT